MHWTVCCSISSTPALTSRNSRCSETEGSQAAIHCQLCGPLLVSWLDVTLASRSSVCSPLLCSSQLPVSSQPVSPLLLLSTLCSLPACTALEAGSCPVLMACLHCT